MGEVCRDGFIKPLVAVGVFLITSCFTLSSNAQQGEFNLNDWITTPAASKPLYVKAIMEQAGVNKISLQMSADFYVKELDRLASFSLERHYKNFLKIPVAQNLATLAVIHCDWNNGVDPYDFARNYLGKQLETLKALYPEAMEKLEHHCKNEE